jgi:hypothetical protein
MRQPTNLFGGYAEFPQERGNRASPLTLFETIAAQLLPNPFVHMDEFRSTCRVADNLHQAGAPVPPGPGSRGAVRLSAAPRSSSLSICSLHLKIRLLWPLLTSLHLSRRIAPTVVRCVRTRAETSSGKTCLFSRTRRIYLPAFRTTIGHPRPWPGSPR